MIQYAHLTIIVVSFLERTANAFWRFVLDEERKKGQVSFVF
jgi:hypothetical protein